MPTKDAYRYEIGGFRLKSDTAFSLLPDRSRSKRIPEIEFRLKAPGTPAGETSADKEEVGQIKNGAGYPSITVYRLENKFLLDCHNTNRRVEFVVSGDGRKIECYPHNGARREDIEVWLFGLVLSFLLQSRGIYTLHAAAVNCRDRAVAFLGNNGYGKTTLAFYFLQRGHSLITDDVLPLVKKKNRLFVLPGSPTMNLWSRTLSELGANGNLSEKFGTPKQRYSIDALNVGFCQSETPLSNIYLLWPSRIESVSRVEITPVPRARALVELLAHTRANSVITVPQQKSLLKAYARLLSQVPVRRLIYPVGFEFLPQIYDAVLRDLSI